MVSDLAYWANEARKTSKYYAMPAKEAVVTAAEEETDEEELVGMSPAAYSECAQNVSFASCFFPGESCKRKRVSKDDKIPKAPKISTGIRTNLNRNWLSF